MRPPRVHHIHLRLQERDLAGRHPAREPEEQGAAHGADVLGQSVRSGSNPKDFRVQLTNLGLAQRPDLFDAHTIHWHGFRNVITFFDGEPTGSVAVTTGRIFQYIYRPRDPGTYMFHCHVEDVEHVHMGMNGPVHVRPLQIRQHRRSTRAASTPTTTATARPATTASSACSFPKSGVIRTGPTRTSSCPSGATTVPTSRCSTDGCIPTRSNPTRRSTSRHPPIPS